MRKAVGAGVLLGLGSALVGCGAGGAAETIRPADPSAASALSEAPCRAVDGEVDPLVVDWKPEQRGDLEVAMREGVAVVSYDCQSFRLLADCHIAGEYGFMGMTKKEQIVRIENSDELKANLPLNGASLGAELARGSTIDIAIVMVGKKRTTWQEPTTADLQGKCDGATHYVRGATLGAFAVATGTKAETKAAAAIFGASASGASASGKETNTREGDPADCAGATPDSANAPAQCGAPIRLALAPIVKATATESAPPPAKPSAAGTESGCPAGLVSTDGKCTTPASAAAYQCEPSNAAQCKEQCDKGHAGSCATLAELSARDDATGAAQAAKKACDGNVAKGCGFLGALTAAGRGVGADAAAAVKLFEKGCDGGDATSCGELGRATASGQGTTQDAARAADILQKACAGGDMASCADAAKLLGTAPVKDPAVPVKLHQRACDGGIAASCTEFGLAVEAGAPGISKNPIVAELTFRRGCYRGNAESCAHLARTLVARPQGDPTNEAKTLFDRACAQRVALGCAALKVLYADTRPVLPDVAQTQTARTRCNNGSARDCATIGLFDLASGNKAMAAPTLQRACTMGDAWACAVHKRAK